VSVDGAVPGTLTGGPVLHRLRGDP